MDFTISSKNDCVHLAGEITIYAAAALKEQIFLLIQADQPANVDLSGVTAIDSAGLQLLLMVCKVAGGISIHAPSEVARDVLEMCSLRELIVATDDSDE